MPDAQPAQSHPEDQERGRRLLAGAWPCKECELLYVPGNWGWSLCFCHVCAKLDSVQQKHGLGRYA